MLTQVSAGPGDEVPVGQVIALLLAEGEAAAAPAAVRASPARPARALPASPVAAKPAAASRGAPAVVAASPLARRLAAEHGVDLSELPATSGRISKADVLAWLQREQKADEAALTPNPSSRRSRREPFSGRGASSANAGRVTGRPVMASPLARRLAAERGIELATLAGSGPQGAVLGRRYSGGCARSCSGARRHRSGRGGGCRRRVARRAADGHARRHCGAYPGQRPERAAYLPDPVGGHERSASIAAATLSGSRGRRRA